jgi:hypothetical protein
VKRIALGWFVFLGGPVAFTVWDHTLAYLRHTQLPMLECLEPRTWVLLGALGVAAVTGTTTLSGGWGLALRILVILGQIAVALALLFLVLQPAQAELGGYPGLTCGDL